MKHLKRVISNQYSEVPTVLKRDVLGLFPKEVKLRKKLIYIFWDSKPISIARESINREILIYQPEIIDRGKLLSVVLFVHVLLCLFVIAVLVFLKDLDFWILGS